MARIFEPALVDKEILNLYYSQKRQTPIKSWI